jgi:hypothetical protein
MRSLFRAVDGGAGAHSLAGAAALEACALRRLQLRSVDVAPPHPVFAIASSADGRYVAVSCRDHAVHVFRVSVDGESVVDASLPNQVMTMLSL